MGVRRTTRSRAIVAVLLLIIVGGALALAACGGSGETAASPPGVTPTPSLAAGPEQLAGTDPVAVTQKTVDAYAAASNARNATRVGAFYARDVVFHCFATGVHVEGRTALLELLKQVWAGTRGGRTLAARAGRGWAVLELRQDFEGGSLQLLQLVETRDGKIVRLENYYQPLEGQVGPLRVASPLRSAPGPADTAAAAEAVALKYAAALRAKDAAAVCALCAPDNDFRDTAGDSSSPAGENQHYAGIFRAPSDLAFSDLRYVFGRGWAAVRWTADSGGSGGSGVTVLEIRDGKIRRETLYYNGTRMPFRL